MNMKIAQVQKEDKGSLVLIKQVANLLLLGCQLGEAVAVNEQERSLGIIQKNDLPIPDPTKIDAEIIPISNLAGQIKKDSEKANQPEFSEN